MHLEAVAAWIFDLQSAARLPLSPYHSTSPSLQFRKRTRPGLCENRRPRKTRRVALANMASNDHNRAIEKQRLRTSSPPKCKFLSDAHEPDHESGNHEDNGRTPRPARLYPIPDLPLYPKTLVAIIDVDVTYI